MEDPQQEPQQDEQTNADQVSLDQKLDNDVNPSPTLSGAAAQAGFTPERFKSGRHSASIFTMVVLAAGCLVLGFLYYSTVKNLHSTNSSLATAQRQNSNLEGQLKAINVPGTASQDSQAGITVKIPELGLQYQDTGQFSDLMWVVSGNNLIVDSRSVIQKQLLAAQNSPSTINDCGFGSTPVGQIMKIDKNNLSSTLSPSLSVVSINSAIKDGKAKDMGSYYLYFVHAQSTCGAASVYPPGVAVDKIAPVESQISPFLKALQALK